MAKKSHISSLASVGCGFLFLLPFAGVGVFMIGLICWNLTQWAQVSNWVEGEATILEFKVRGGGDTIGAVAKYSYEWEGEKYENDRVSLIGGTDNIGSFQQRVVKELKHAYQKKLQVPCFINPRKPEQSILYRELRWEMIAFFTIFAELFGGIGLGGIIVMLLTRGELVDEEELKAHHPDEPWKWKRDWLNGIISSSGGSSKPGAAIFIAAYWNIVAMPMFIITPMQMFQGNTHAAFGLLYPIIGSLLGVWAIRVCVRKKKFGTSTFRILNAPGVIGGRLEGALMIDHALYPDEGFEFRLSCREIIRRHKDTDTDTLYEDTQVIGYESAVDINGQMAVPVSFRIPYDNKDTDTGGSRTVTWEIRVKAKVPGVDYVEEFEVPVFKTAESSQEVVSEDTETTLLDNLADPDAPLYRANLRLDEDEWGNLHIKAPIGRNFGAAVGLGTFAAIWLTSVFFMYQQGGPPFLIIFALIGFLCVYGAINILMQTADIEVNGQEILYKTGWLFFRWQKAVPLQDIKDFNYKQIMTSGKDGYYRIYLEKVNQKCISLITYVKGQAACRRLINILEERVR